MTGWKLAFQLLLQAIWQRLMLLRGREECDCYRAYPVRVNRILMLLVKRLKVLRILVFICFWLRRQSTGSISFGWRRSRCSKPLNAAIRYAKKYFSKIEFSPEDAGRTELDFLCEVTAMAIRAGATVVNIPDTVGYMNPSEFGNIFKTLKSEVPGIEKIQLKRTLS